MKLSQSPILITTIGLIVVNALSLFNYFQPGYAWLILSVIALVVFILSLYRLEYGLLVVISELIIGSKGRLLEEGFLSLRMVLFGAVMLAYLIKSFKHFLRLPRLEFTKEKTWPYLIALTVFLILSVLIGVVRGHDLRIVFADANSWLFLPLILPLIKVYFRADKDVYERLVKVIITSLIWLALFTLFILYAFTHQLPIIKDLYWWLRRTELAEVTAAAGSWSRVFLQSHIYPALAVVILPFAVKKYQKYWWALSVLVWTTLIISMSRSFWLSVLIVLGAGLILTIILEGWRKMWSRLGFITASAVLGAVLILSTVLFPFPKATSLSADAFTDRLEFNTDEPALASRWSLLPPLWQGVKEHWLLGSGFGREIIYQTSDPRVLDTQGTSQYKTYAFEWGYLGLWLKLGLGGLLAYLGVLIITIYQNIKAWRQGNNLLGALSLGLLTLLVINFFTPYLDHPLGFIVWMLILIFSVSLSLPNKDLPEKTK